MSDLRDEIHKPSQSEDDKLFLAYHDNSDIAQRRVEARQIRLTPESRRYMQTELDRRARIKAEFEAKDKVEKERLNATPQPQAVTVQADAPSERVSPAVDLGGAGGDPPAD